MKSAIVAHKLGKKYGRNWGLRDCSLEIPENRIVGLVGPNGAGKSTLMDMLVGLSRPTTGTLSLFGEPVNLSVLNRVGYIDQEHSLYRDFTVAEMLKTTRLLNERCDDEFATARLAELRIPLDRKVGKLSGGQRAQVAMTLAFAKSPELLVLDEPVSSLDPVARKDVMSALMAAKADRDCTVMISSHVVSELARLCDYLVVLDHGQVRLTGEVDKLLDGHRVVSGPLSSVDRVAAEFEVIHRDDDGDTASLLVRNSRELRDPMLHIERANLETLVMHYLQASVTRDKEVAA